MSYLHNITQCENKLNEIAERAEVYKEKVVKRNDDWKVICSKAKGLIENQKKERVKFSIGGVLFETYKETVMKYPNSLLARILESDYYTKDKTKEIIIDRNPIFFKQIMLFYRNGYIEPEYINDDQFYQEVQYYELQHYIKQIQITEKKEKNIIERIIIAHPNKENDTIIQDINQCEELLNEKSLNAISANGNSDIIIELSQPMLISSLILREFSLTNNNDYLNKSIESPCTIQFKENIEANALLTTQYTSSLIGKDQLIHINLTSPIKAKVLVFNNNNESLLYGISYLKIING